MAIWYSIRTQGIFSFQGDRKEEDQISRNKDKRIPET